MSRNNHHASKDPPNPRNHQAISTAATTAARPQARRGPSGAWSRLKPAVIDPLEVYGLPSKGETRLHDHKNQESYYGKIVARYMKFCASSGGGEELQKAFAAMSVTDTATLTGADHAGKAGGNSSSTSDSRPDPPSRQISTTPRPNDLPNILLAMRKLREGILGSRRRDHFAQRAYIFLIHASILTGHWESYQPALLYLLHSIHRSTPLSPPELQEFAGYYVLDLACRQAELMEAFAARREFGVRDRRVRGVVMSLVHEDWVSFWRARRAVDGYQRAIMEFAVERMRLHALKCLGRGYMSAEKGFVERCGDAGWVELVKGGVGWQLLENGSVVIRKPKPK